MLNKVGVVLGCVIVGLNKVLWVYFFWLVKCFDLLFEEYVCCCIKKVGEGKEGGGGNCVFKGMVEL